MTEKLLETVKGQCLIDEGDTIIVGLSGGADSVCLLHWLFTISEKLKVRLVAVHINHCLRGEQALSDENFCKEFCSALKIPIEVYRFDIGKISKDKGITEEEAGRLKRYYAFREALKKYNGCKIAVAHNKNDQAETFLIRMFRGSGTAGLSAMQFKNGNIIRPLLCTSREDIEDYCKSNNLLYATDESNYDTVYTRNKVRHSILPLIKNEFNKNIIDTLYRSAQLIGDENRFLNSLADEKLEECLVEEGKILLSINKLRSLDIVLQRRVMRKAISLMGEGAMKDVSYYHIEEVLSLTGKPSGKRIALPSGTYVERQYNCLYVSKVEEVGEYCYNIAIGDSLEVTEARIYVQALLNPCADALVYTKAFDYDKIKTSLQLRNRRAGDKICINGCGKKLKKYFSDEKIPLSIRRAMPLIADGNNVIWVIGDKKESDLYKVTKETKNILYLKIWEGQYAKD